MKQNLLFRPACIMSCLIFSLGAHVSSARDIKTVGIGDITHPENGSKSIYHSSSSDNKTFYTSEKLLSPALAESETFEVTCNLVYEEGRDRPQDLQYAISLDSGAKFRAFANNSQVVFNLPQGKYDFVITFSSDMGTKLVVSEGVEINGNCQKTFISNEACFRTRFVPVDANGEEMTFGTVASEAQNLDIAEVREYFIHKKGGYLFDVAAYWAEQGDRNLSDVWSNDQNSVLFPFYLKGVNYKDGVFAVAIYPEEVKIQKLSNDPQDWKTYDFNYAGSELKDSSEEVKIINDLEDSNYFISLPEFNDYRFSWFSFYNTTSSVKHVCIKEDGVFGTKSNFIPMKLFGEDGSNSLGIMTPLVKTNEDLATTLEVSPKSMISQLLYSLSAGVGQYALINGKYCFDENPYFSYTYSDDMIFGNSCPIWLPAIVDRGSKLALNYSFVGRLGEVRTVDMANHKIKVLSGDNTIIDNFQSLKDAYGSFEVNPNAAVDIEVQNRNLMIDDKVQINGTANLHLERSESETAVPVVTMLQFRNFANLPTDRFSPDKAKLLLTASTFTSSVVNFWEINQTPSEISSLNVEYAPLNSDDFKSLTLDKGDYIPVYGWLYTSDLSSLENEEDGWYTLRLVATSASGSRMEQVISPAFKLDKNLGVETFNVNNIEEMLDAPDVEVYDLYGMKCSKNNIKAGIYIVRHSGKAHKIIIR